MVRYYSVLLGVLMLTLVFASISLAQQSTCGQIVQGVKSEKADYAIGDRISFDYTVQNNTNQTVSYNFPTTKQYDVWVTHGGEEEVYRLSKGKGYLSMATTLTLKPGERRCFSTTWDQKDDAGRQCPPGSYTICAQITCSGRGPAMTTGHMRIGIKSAALVPTKINEAISNYDSLVGKRVRIFGTYKGYSPTRDANTKNGPPVNRSDWVVCDSTGCIYVVGSIALDPTKDSGTDVTLVGTLKKTPEGQVYLNLETATIGRKAGGACPP